VANVPLHILDEDRLTLDEARPVLGTPQKPLDLATVFKAGTFGTLLPDGSRQHLEMLKVGGRWITSKQAIRRYVSATTTAWLKRDDPAPPVRTPSKGRQVHRARIDRELDEVGIK
jgi:hypothetical protein